VRRLQIAKVSMMQNLQAFLFTWYYLKSVLIVAAGFTKNGVSAHETFPPQIPNSLLFQVGYVGGGAALVFHGFHPPLLILDCPNEAIK